MLFDAFALVAGIALLVTGAESLVRGASRLAAAFRVSPLVIGLTIAAFGTSAPELVVSVTAALRGQGAIAIGNVVGSNVFNVLAVLGPAALIAPILIHRNVVRREVPLMIGVSLVFLLVSLNGRIGRMEGAILLASLVAYTTYAFVAARRESAPVDDEVAEILESGRRVKPWMNPLFVLAGLALLLVGGHFVVQGAVGLARGLGVGERIIALTIIAAGTSLPELATTLVAAWRKEMDIAVGNIVGSNVFNILGIIGAAAVAGPLTVTPEMLRFDIPLMLVVALALFPIVLNKRIGRREGAVLVLAYVAYLVILLTRGGL